MADKEKTENKDLQDIFEDRRYFINDGPNGDGKKYYIDPADIDSVRQADWHYAKTYNEALLAGVATQAQMEDILRDRGIVGKEYDKAREVLITDLDAKVIELETIEDKDAKLKLAD